MVAGLVTQGMSMARPEPPLPGRHHPAFPGLPCGSPTALTAPGPLLLPALPPLPPNSVVMPLDNAPSEQHHRGTPLLCFELIRGRFFRRPAHAPLHRRRVVRRHIAAAPGHVTPPPRRASRPLSPPPRAYISKPRALSREQPFPSPSPGPPRSVRCRMVLGFDRVGRNRGRGSSDRRELFRAPFVN